MITLFHRPTVPSSLRVLTLLKQVSAHASETATEDQATDHTSQNKLQRTEFELNVTEEPPTSDQVRTILEYVGERQASQLVDGARDAQDAIHNLKEDSRRFKVPVVSPSRLSEPYIYLFTKFSVQTVDWNNGRAGKCEVHEKT